MSSTGYKVSDLHAIGGHTLSPMEQERARRLAYVLRAARERQGLTPPQLAERLDVFRGTVNSWEQGKSIPSILMLGPLCDALGVSAELFRDLPDEPPSPVEAYLRPAAEEGVREGLQRGEKRSDQ
jgi:transcriptional regulator with XRE-family HTH domain